MKTGKHWIVLLLIGLIIVAGGVALLIRADLFKQIIIIALGAAAVLAGIRSLVIMSRYSFGRFNASVTLIKGVLGIIVGVLAVVMPLATAETVWTFFIYVLAVQMIIASFSAFSDAIALKRLGFGASFFIWEGAVSLALACILFLFPKGIADILITIIGVVIIAVGVAVGLTAVIWVRKRRGVIEAEVELLD
ncbi:MAG: hypothetical protein ACOXZ4_02030 [Sphaerochaetaceae bacterium]